MYRNASHLFNLLLIDDFLNVIIDFLNLLHVLVLFPAASRLFDLAQILRDLSGESLCLGERGLPPDYLPHPLDIEPLNRLHMPAALDHLLNLSNLLALLDPWHVLTLDSLAPLADPVDLRSHALLDLTYPLGLDLGDRCDDPGGHLPDHRALGFHEVLKGALQLPDECQVLLQLAMPHTCKLLARGQLGLEVARAGVLEVADRVTRMLGHALQTQKRTVFEAEQVQRLGRVQLT